MVQGRLKNSNPRKSHFMNLAAACRRKVNGLVDHDRIPFGSKSYDKIWSRTKYKQLFGDYTTVLTSPGHNTECSMKFAGSAVQ